MSLFFKDNSESINDIKSQKDIILEKIHRIKSYNNNLSREYYPIKKTNTKNNTLISPFYARSKNIVYNSNQNSLFKKVFIKPLVKKNRIYNTKQKYLTNNCTLNKNLNVSKIQKLNKNINDKLDINNNSINKNGINLQNKTIINNENSLNETTSYYDIEKLSCFNKNNTINNNIDNNIIDNFFILEKAKKNNIISLKNRNNQNRKKSSEINRIWLKNDNNININILEKVHTTKGKDTININSINLISNDNIHKIDNPLYLSKIFSLSNAINQNYIIRNNNNQINKKENNVRNKKIDKMKKQYFLNKTNVDNTKTNEDSLPKSHYYSSITEVKEKSNMKEKERSGLNENNNKIKKINILEIKRNILKSIEEQKQKIIDESIKNYRKYLYLIQRQQKEYEEYDKYLKSELNNNKNNQLKLQLFKDKLKIGVNNTTSHMNALKNKKLILFKPGISPSEKDNKTSLSKNFDYQKHRNKKTKNSALSNNNDFDEKRLLTTSDTYEPLLSEENNSNCIYNLKTSNYAKTFKPINKNILKIDINEIKNKNKKNNIYVNLKKRTKTSKPKKNISNANINYFSIDVLKKTNPKLKKESKQQIIKFKKEAGNKLPLNNIKRGKVFGGLIKNIKTAKEKKKNSKQLNKAVISDLGNSHIKCNSLSKLGKSEEYLDTNIINNITLNNNQEIHRMITEEKKKSMNKLNTNNLKFKEKKNNINNYYYFQISNKELKENNLNNLNKEYTTESYKIKNGLYYSAFKTNDSEESNNEK